MILRKFSFLPMLKQLFSFFLIAFFVASAAQAQSDRFGGDAACVAAVKEGDVRWYEPTFFDHRFRRPPRHIAISRALEQRACVEMWTVDGWKWVPQPGVPQKGSQAPLFDFDSDGEPIRRSDCGNAVRKIIYVPVPAPPPPPPPKPEPSAPPPPPPPDPSCHVTGTPKEGFTGFATNGEGRWIFGEKEIEGTVFMPPTLPPGTYRAKFVVIGVGGVKETCEGVWDVFFSASVVLPPKVEAPKLAPITIDRASRPCGRAGWKCWVPPLTLAVGYGIYRSRPGSSPQAPGGLKPPTTTISPASAGVSMTIHR